MITQRFCKKRFYWKFRNRHLTELVGKVHSVACQMGGIQNGGRFGVANGLYRVKGKRKG